MCDIGELTKYSLKEEAEGMMGQIKDNPIFENMMNQMDSKNMNNNFSEEKSPIEKKTELSHEEKKKKLREKIKEKKNNR